MPFAKCRSAIIASAFVAAATFGAQAQTAPIKPGLWQVHMEREVNGQKAPDMSDRLKNLPPEKRGQSTQFEHHDHRQMGGRGLRRREAV